jgi:hypothetical protein
MNKLFISFAITVFSIPVVASAASVQVYPTITTAYGNEHPAMPNPSAADIYTRIVQGSWSNQQTGVPTYQLPGAGNYQVQFFPPPGYSYTADAGCSGTIQTDQDIICNVDYKDGVPIPPTPPPPLITTPQPTSTPTPVSQPTPAVVQTQSVSVPIPTAIPAPVETPSPVTAKASTPAPAAAPKVITKTIIVHEYATTTPTESTTTTQDIQALQQRVGVLEQIVSVLQRTLSSIRNFLGL